MDKYNVLVTVYEVHDRFRRVAERKREERKTAVRQEHVKSMQHINLFSILLSSNSKEVREN